MSLANNSLGDGHIHMHMGIQPFADISNLRNQKLAFCIDKPQDTYVCNWFMGTIKNLDFEQ